MIFVLITFLAAFLIEGLGTYVSVIGLSTLFGANPVIIALAVALDLGKLVVVSLLYTYWKKLGKLMKTYALIASAITMIITSAGAAGYLSGEFQKAIMGTQEVGLKVDVLKQEQAKLEARKKQIDDSIAAIPDRYTANQKIRLMNQYKAEQKQVTDRLNDISKQLPDMQIQQIGVEAKAGPILYVAKAFDIPVESAVKWVILMIIFVFDPLAVFLIISGNFLLHQRRLHKDSKVSDADLFADDSPKLDAALAKFNPVKHGGEWPDDIDEPGTGNSVVNFDEQIRAMPPELRELRVPKAAHPFISPFKVDGPHDSDVDQWLEDNAWRAENRGTEDLPNRAVVEPTPPIFEVLQPTPVSPEVAPEPAPIVEEPPAPAPEPTRAPEPREQITLDRLRAHAAPYHSSLNDVKPDDTLTFDENPRATPSRMQYANYKRG